MSISENICPHSLSGFRQPVYRYISSSYLTKTDISTLYRLFISSKKPPHYRFHVSIILFSTQGDLLSVGTRSVPQPSNGFPQSSHCHKQISCHVFLWSTHVVFMQSYSFICKNLLFWSLCAFSRVAFSPALSNYYI